jgi:hypothetical protein
MPNTTLLAAAAPDAASDPTTSAAWVEEADAVSGSGATGWGLFSVLAARLQNEHGMEGDPCMNLFSDENGRL